MKTFQAVVNNELLQLTVDEDTYDELNASK